MNQTDTNSSFYAAAMKIVLFFLSLSFFLASPSVFADRILILGDSLSAAYDLPWESGWAQLLEKDYEGSHEIINASVSGETTGGGLARAQALLDSHQPDWVIVELGGNNGLQGHPIRVIRNNLQQIGALVTKHNAKPIFFGVQIPPNYGERYNNAFKEIFPEVAEEFEAPYLDFYLPEVATNPDLMLRDGIHPNLDAQPIIRDYVKEFLDEVFE